jgi:hypothetical protein
MSVILDLRTDFDGKNVKLSKIFHQDWEIKSVTWKKTRNFIFNKNSITRIDFGKEDV